MEWDFATYESEDESVLWLPSHARTDAVATGFFLAAQFLYAPKTGVGEKNPASDLSVFDVSDADIP